MRRGPRDKIWVLEGASAKSVELALVKDLRLRNPERAKDQKEDDEEDSTTSAYGMVQIAATIP
jgi:hypothetical protein